MLVKEYQEGKLDNLLAKEYRIKSSTVIKRWVKSSEKFGKKGLLRKKGKEKPLKKSIEEGRLLDRLHLVDKLVKVIYT
jgi:hypothetical protein